MSSDLQRITNDIARARERIAQMEAGQRGVIPEGSRHLDAGRAYENQLHAQRQALERFEFEYCNAMLAEHKWSAARVIEAMEAPAVPKPTAAAEPASTQPTLTLGDATRARLTNLLEDHPGSYIPRSLLKEILQK